MTLLVAVMLLAAHPAKTPTLKPAPKIDFDAAKANAIADAGTGPGKDYSDVSGMVWAPLAQDALDACSKTQEETPFDLLFHIDEKGKVQEVLVKPDSKFTACVKAKIGKPDFGPPPKGDWWLQAHMDL